MTARALPAIASLTFHANRGAESYLRDLARGRRRSPDTSPRQLARDITNGVVEEQLGQRPARHRKEVQS